MSRLLLLLTLSALPACRCLSPVMEADAGTDAGTVIAVDAGADSGILDAGQSARDGGCVTDADCPIEGPAGLCNLAAQQSCIDGQCIRDCQVTPRTCSTISENPRCLKCTRPSTFTACSNDQPNTCGVSRCAGTLTVERSTCSVLTMGTTLTSATDTQTCLQSALKSDGSGEFMSFFAVDGEQLAGRINGLGTCLSRSLQTGAPRATWACPNGCEFQIVGCE